jgi:hypothetical protein
MRDSCRIIAGGSSRENKRVYRVQVFCILKEVESGIPVVNPAREHGVSPSEVHSNFSLQGV